MTQTIRKIQRLPSGYVCDIYYHPNNASGKITDKGVRFSSQICSRKLDTLECELKNFATDELGRIDWDLVGRDSYQQTKILAMGNGAKYEIYGDNQTYYAKNLKEVLKAFENFNC